MRFVFFIVLFASLVSCGGKKIEKPPIGQQKMIEILVDIHLLEAQQQTLQPFEKGRVFNTIVGYEKIFLKHNVTNEQFYDSFSYYRQHPKEMDDLYQLVIDETVRRESELSSKAALEKANEQKRKIDSSSTKPLSPTVNEW